MDGITAIADGFWNIRGTFRVLGLVDVGTQMSLVRLGTGGFALLDSYALSGEVEDEVLALTEDGDAIEAILNLHPFHTVHVEAVAARFPKARLYGTARHHAKFPSLRWAPERTEGADCAALFADDLELMVPPGVELVPDNENLHFGSVLAIHRASRTLHVDDTLNWWPQPFGARLGFHPTLGSVLEPRPGAAAALRTWAEALIERCGEVDRICTAHARRAPLEGADAIQAQLRDALGRIEKTLAKHEARYDREAPRA